MGSGGGDRAMMMELMLAGQKARSSAGLSGPRLGQGRVSDEEPFVALVKGRLWRVQPFLWTSRCDALPRKSRRKPRWDSRGLRQAAVKACSAWGEQSCACCSSLCLWNLYLPFRTKGFLRFSLCFYQCRSKNGIFQWIFPFFKQLLSKQPLLSANKVTTCSILAATESIWS